MMIMFWLKVKKQSETERKISNMHSLLTRSFTNVKNDTQNIFSWLKYFQQKNQDQENKIKQLQLEISCIPKNPEDIRKIIDSYYSFDSMAERIKMLNEKIDNLAVKKTSPEAIMPEMQAIEQRLNSLEEQRKATIREKL